MKAWNSAELAKHRAMASWVSTTSGRGKKYLADMALPCSHSAVYGDSEGLARGQLRSFGCSGGFEGACGLFRRAEGVLVHLKAFKSVDGRVLCVGLSALIGQLACVRRCASVTCSAGCGSLHCLQLRYLRQAASKQRGCLYWQFLTYHASHALFSLAPGGGAVLARD